MKIGKIKIGLDFEPLVVAEISGNHNKSIKNIISILRHAKKIGVKAVKLQTYTPDTLTIKSNRKEFYINKKSKLWKGENLYNLYKKGFTPWEWHKKIFDEAKKLDILCFSSPFDETAVDFLESLNVKLYKVASFEITHVPLLIKIAKTKKPVILSTGMATSKEIKNAIKILKMNGTKDLVILKCTSNYPASIKNSNIKTIADMRKKFNCEIGLSDHTIGNTASITSIAYGATVIEKHITLDKKIKTIDSKFSLDIKEFKLLLNEIKNAWLSLGKVYYGPTKEEIPSLKYRRSIYLIKNKKKGSIIEKEDLKIIRPNIGMSPKFYFKIIGKRAAKNLKAGSPLKKNDVN